MSDPIERTRPSRDALECEALGHKPDQDEDTAALARELDSVMSSLLTPMPPSVGLRAKLEATVAQPPMRYAPFYDRLAELFDLSESALVAELARLRDPRVWRFTGLPGVRDVAVQGGPRVAGAETVLARFAPGTRFPRHRHGGVERVLVLEGSYTDSAGIEHRAGEYREWPVGSKHSFRVSKTEICIFASVVFGREFEALPLRLLARALGH